MIESILIVIGATALTMGAIYLLVEGLTKVVLIISNLWKGKGK